LAGPYYGFDAIFAIDGDPARYRELVGAPVRRVAAPETPWNPEIGRVLAHRSILGEALQQDLRRILVLEGDPVRDIAYESADFERVLAELPDTPTKIALWLRKQGSLEAHGFGVRAFGCNI
jgi:hypothetical protein